MADRCPDSLYLGSATLRGYRQVFDGWSDKWQGSTANIVKSEPSSTQGALYQLTKDDIAELDGYEPNYSRKIVKVLLDGETRKAYIYSRKPLQEGSPSKEYLDAMGFSEERSPKSLECDWGCRKTHNEIAT